MRSFNYLIIMLLFLFSEKQITCSTWPTSETFGCIGGGNWKTLDLKTSLATSQTACEQLCIEQGKKGCCYWAVHGCHWKRGGRAVAGGHGLAVSCSSSGTLPQHFRY